MIDPMLSSLLLTGGGAALLGSAYLQRALTQLPPPDPAFDDLMARVDHRLGLTPVDTAPIEEGANGSDQFLQRPSGPDTISQ